MAVDTISTTADTLIFTISNFCNQIIYLEEDYFLFYYDEKEDQWVDYYYPPYNGQNKRELFSRESTQFVIPLESRHFNRYNKGKYYLRPGKYLFRKYADVPITVDFIMSDT